MDHGLGADFVARNMAVLKEEDKLGYRLAGREHLAAPDQGGRRQIEYPTDVVAVKHSHGGAQGGGRVVTSSCRMETPRHTSPGGRRENGYEVDTVAVKHGGAQGTSSAVVLPDAPLPDGNLGRLPCTPARREDEEWAQSSR
jgi:hypothetical protein